MNSDLSELYQEIILEHNRHPRNYRAMTDADRRVEADNPLCGDRLQLYLKLEGDRVVDISFQGSGCAISIASVSMLTERLKGATVREAKDLFEVIHDLMTGKQPPEAPLDLGELEALIGVRKYPMRVKCATMSWHALKAALSGDRSETVTTE